MVTLRHSIAVFGMDPAHPPVCRWLGLFGVDACQGEESRGPLDSSRVGIPLVDDPTNRLGGQLETLFGPLAFGDVSPGRDIAVAEFRDADGEDPADPLAPEHVLVKHLLDLERLARLDDATISIEEPGLAVGGQEFQESATELLFATHAIVAACRLIHELGAEVDDLPLIVPNRGVDREAVDQVVERRAEPLLASPEPILGFLPVRDVDIDSGHADRSAIAVVIHLTLGQHQRTNPSGRTKRNSVS